MKRVFVAIGFLISVYSVYFMFCVADYKLYMNDEHYYDFVLEKSMTMEELSVYAKDCGVVIQVREYLSVAPGHYELNIYALNLDEPSWDKKTLLPHNKIHIVSDISEDSYNELVSIFMVQTDNEDKINSLVKMLEEDGHVINNEMCDEGDTSFKFSYMFNYNNSRLFILVFVLIVFSSIIYYLTRTKEIGIRKLQGWNSFEISLLLNSRIIAWSLVGLIPVTVIFVIYIFAVNKADLLEYLYMLFLLICCLLIVNIFAILGSCVVVDCLGTINAIKASKNEGFLMLILIGTKIVSTVLFCAIINIMSDSIVDTVDMINNKHEDIDFYRIDTSSVDEGEIKSLNEYLHKIDENYVYNYDSSMMLYSKSKLEKAKRIEEAERQCENNMIIVSYNILKYLNVNTENEKNINDFTDDLLILPQYMKNKVSEVISYLELDSDTQIILMKNDQYIGDLNYPGYYAFNPVILVKPLKTGLYINNGDIWYSNKVVDDIAKYLEENNYGISKVQLRSLKEERKSYIANKCIDLSENIFMSVISVLVFCITSYALIVSLVQYRKKKIAVYVLNGKKPESAIMTYLVGIMMIDIIIAIAWEWQLICIVILELLYAIVEILKLQRNGTCRVINGE